MMAPPTIVLIDSSVSAQTALVYLAKCVNVRVNQSLSSFINRRSEYNVFLHKSLQITFPNKALRKRGAESAELINI